MSVMFQGELVLPDGIELSISPLPRDRHVITSSTYVNN
jgi:hypothetical protein